MAALLDTSTEWRDLRVPQFSRGVLPNLRTLRSDIQGTSLRQSKCSDLTDSIRHSAGFVPQTHCLAQPDASTAAVRDEGFLFRSVPKGKMPAHSSATLLRGHFATPESNSCAPARSKETKPSLWTPSLARTSGTLIFPCFPTPWGKERPPETPNRLCRPQLCFTPLLRCRSIPGEGTHRLPLPPLQAWAWAKA